MKHKLYLLHALALAKTTAGYCAPNPAVGAVLVKNNRIIGEGYHNGPGTAHAEVNAIMSSKMDPQDATLYVTLEPCCHFGRTPPCTDLLIKNNIKTVYFGAFDPNPIVAEKGIAKLREAGIECYFLNLNEIESFYKPYAYRYKVGRPFVTAKIALSLDGKIAGEHSSPINITGEAAALYTHQQRDLADAIFTTSRTVNNDNPQLNVRLKNKTAAKRVYILDRHLTLNKNARIYQTAKEVVVIHNENLTAANHSNVSYKPIPVAAHNINFPEILKLIGNDGIANLWVEAGAYCFNELLAQNLVDKALIYISLKTFGPSALSAFAQLQPNLLKAKEIHWKPLGEDALCELLF